MHNASDPTRSIEIHPSAVVEPSATLGSGLHVGPHCDIAGDVTLAADVVLAANVVVGSGASIGARTDVGPGASVSSGVSIGTDVNIGPNAAILGERERTDSTAQGRTTVGDHVTVGANASILPGIVVGSHAAIGAGSVVTRDIPAYATAVGSPARIVGYQSSRDFTNTPRMRASSFRDDEFPKAIGKASLSLYPHITDLRGSLSFGEVGAQLPFDPKRYFLVFDVPSREVRGEHAHRELHQLLICVKGECAVAIDDGIDRAEVMLDRPNAALHLPPMVWGSQYRYSPDAVLMVLTSDVYEADDYVRDYDEFTALVHGN